MSQNVLEIRDLHVHFQTDDGLVRAVNGADLEIPRSRVVALVGESGCGKSVTALAVMGLVQAPGRIARGRVTFFPAHGPAVDLTRLAPDGRTMRGLRGGALAMIFQEPATAFSPVHTVGRQLVEALRLHRDLPAEAARARAVAMMARVGIPDAARQFDRYAFQLSGGMRQRLMIAMALLCEPELIIADEPTTALDVTIQAQVLSLLEEMQRATGAACLLITHDLGVVAQTADFVAVMYLGRVVEVADVEAFYDIPRHPYSMDLMGSLPGRCYEGRLRAIRGEVPSPFTRVPGCPYHPRCMYAVPGRCDRGEPPPMLDLGEGRRVACLRAGEVEMERESLVFARMFHADTSR